MSLVAAAAKRNMMRTWWDPERVYQYAHFRSFTRSSVSVCRTCVEFCSDSRYRLRGLCHQSSRGSCVQEVEGNILVRGATHQGGL